MYGAELKNISVKRFLECYFKQECLWNSRISSYKDKGSRTEAYENIVKDLKIKGITHNDIRTKIKGIRTTYKKELEISLFKKSKGISYEPKLCWFKQADAFLRSVSTSRHAVRLQNDRMKEPIPVITNERLKGMENSEDEAQQINFEEVKIGTSNFEELQSEETYRYDDFVQEHQIDTNPLLEKQTPTNNSPSIQTYYRVEQPKEDEYQHFCNSVAAQLRSIPDAYSRSVAKFKIQQILFEAETGHYKKNACVTIPITN